MKKTIQKPDGSVETVEGTAEEIAEYERKLRGDVKEAPKPAGPGLLKDEIKRLSEQPWWTNPVNVPYMQLEHTPTCQLVEASRGWWSVAPPRCTCGLIVYPYRFWYYSVPYTPTTGGVTISSTSDQPFKMV